MDPVLKAYADQGVLALSFGILLAGAIWIIKYLLTQAAAERKEWGDVLRQTSASLVKVSETMDEMKGELRDLSRRLDNRERDDRDRRHP